MLSWREQRLGGPRTTEELVAEEQAIQRHSGLVIVVGRMAPLDVLEGNLARCFRKLGSQLAALVRAHAWYSAVRIVAASAVVSRADMREA